MAKTRTRTTSRGVKPSSTRRKPLFLPWYRRYTWLPWALGAVAIAIAIVAMRGGGTEGSEPGVAVSRPVVGGDLHSLVIDPSDPDTLFIGSHEGASISTDGGATWETVPSLDGADAMGWAFADDAIFVGGHPGISVSSDGRTFEPLGVDLPSTDVHALGGADGVIYAGLAGAGTVASSDGGETWEMRSDAAGGSFMGAIRVDPKDPEHLLAPDMENGVVESRNGGRHWEALGTAAGVMWVSWDPQDAEHMVATTAEGAIESIDGGVTWRDMEVPAGVSLVEMDPRRPSKLYAAVLEAPEAAIFVSTDGGNSWSSP